MWLTLALLLAAEGPGDLLASKERFFKPRIGEVVPRELRFTDEAGNAVTLGDYGNDRPVILVMAYYKCPQLCSLVLNAQTKVLKESQWTAGREFEIVTISIDPMENFDLAKAKKKWYLEQYGRYDDAEPPQEGGNAWFLPRGAAFTLAILLAWNGRPVAGSTLTASGSSSAFYSGCARAPSGRGSAGSTARRRAR